MQGTSPIASARAGRGVVATGQVFARRESLVVALRPPRLAVQRGEVAECGSIVDDEEARDLEVAAVGRLDRGFEDEPDVVDRDRIGSEPADGALREHRLTDRHREPAVVHRHTEIEERRASRATPTVPRSTEQTAIRRIRCRGCD